jgi:NADPH-dependent 2,4-dienoyl-CoA reductase/sulfur reductase-like enzyme
MLLLQVMPPFDPEMVEPVQERLAAKGVELCLGDGLKSFEQQVGQQLLQRMS